MKKLLFLCTANSIRSQLAQGIAEVLTAGKWEVHSAGVIGGGSVHPAVIAVLEEYGAVTDDMWSKGIDELPATTFDVVIALSPEAEDALPYFKGAALREYWQTPDPLAIPALNDRKDSFRQVRDGLVSKIENLLRNQSA